MIPYPNCPYCRAELIITPESSGYYLQDCKNCQLHFNQECRSLPGEKDRMLRYRFDLDNYSASIWNNKAEYTCLCVYYRPSEEYDWGLVLETPNIFEPDFSDLEALKNKLRILITFS